MGAWCHDGATAHAQLVMLCGSQDPRIITSSTVARARYPPPVSGSRTARGNHMDVFEAIATTRAMRRLDPDRDVSDADVLTIVEAATKAATGGNSQPVRWMVVRDAEKRRRLGDIYRECWGPVREMYAAQPEMSNDTKRVLNSADHLGEHMGEAPVI